MHRWSNRGLSAGGVPAVIQKNTSELTNTVIVDGLCEGTHQAAPEHARLAL